MKNLLLKVVHKLGTRSGTFLWAVWYTLDAPNTRFPCMGIIVSGIKIEISAVKEITKDDSYLEWY